MAGIIHYVGHRLGTGVHLEPGQHDQWRFESGGGAIEPGDVRVTIGGYEADVLHAGPTPGLIPAVATKGVEYVMRLQSGMERDLVHRAVEQSREREPLVQALVLMRASRVLSDPRMYAEGVAIAERLDLNDHARWVVIDECVRLGCEVDVDAAEALYRRTPVQTHMPFKRRSSSNDLIQALARKGEFERAVRVVEDQNLDASCAAVVAHAAPDSDIKRRALEAARAHKDPHFGSSYYHMLAAHWPALLDAADWVRRAVSEIEAEPDRHVDATFGNVKFRSMREMNLFTLREAIVGALPRDEADAVLARHPRVARGIREYRPPEPRSGAGGIGFAGAGSREEVEAMISAWQGDRSAVPRLMEAARHKFIEDTDPARPNRAPHVFWPSASLYLSAAYHAGKMAGMDGDDVLEHIPDADIALLARIEFTAGVRGLREHGSVCMKQGR